MCLARLAAIAATAVVAILTITACGPDQQDSGSVAVETAARDAAGTTQSEAEPDVIRLSADAIERYGIAVEPPARHRLVPTIVAPGRVSFNTEAMAHVGSPLEGRVVELSAKVGDTVAEGDVLLIVESPDLGEAQSDYLQKRAAAQTAGPTVDLAENAHERAKALYEKSQGIALTEVQKRELDLRAAKAALIATQAAAVAAENRLHLFGMDQKSVETLAASGEVDPRFAIRAPIAGQVVEREVTLGELVGPERDVLLVLANLTTLWVLADVPEAKLQDVVVGAAVSIALGTGEGPVFDGRVAYIAPEVDPATRTAPVRIEVHDGHMALRAGMFASVRIESLGSTVSRETALAVPDGAVQTIAGRPTVFVPVAGEEGAFTARHITIGSEVDGQIPVLSGLQEGEPIVVSGSFLLKAELGKGSAEGH